MGHYAKRIDEDGMAYLCKSYDQNKDQTYFLSQIDQRQLSYTLFPLGDIDKTEVRRIAHELDLESVMDKKDSTGVCFIGERNFREFLKNYIPAKKGNIVDIETGKILGTHQGAMYYTIGQRKGLNIGGNNDRMFVVGKDIYPQVKTYPRVVCLNKIMSMKELTEKLEKAFASEEDTFQIL